MDKPHDSRRREGEEEGKIKNKIYLDDVDCVIEFSRLIRLRRSLTLSPAIIMPKRRQWKRREGDFGLWNIKKKQKK